MSYVQIRVIKAVMDKLFVDMDPASQAMYVEDHKEDVTQLRELYPRAKDNQVRYLIVENTQDQELAHRLFKNLGMDMAVLKAKLLPFLPLAAQSDIKTFLMEVGNNGPLAATILDNLNPAQSRMLSQSMRTLKIFPESLEGNHARKLQQEPILDVTDVED